MFRVKRLAGVALSLVLLTSLVVAGNALAQGVKSVQLTPSRDSGVDGTATLTDVEGGVRVTLEMRGLPVPGVKHINHIHGGGTCAEDRAGRTAPVTIPLNPLVAKDDGTGAATTTIKGVTLDKLFGKDKDRFILLHSKTEEGQGVPPGISCADLVSGSANDAFDTLPASGGTQPSVLLLGAGVTLTSGAVAGLLALRRRVA